MKKAFSLIELLISLITISVILASLAPVVTHKLKHGGVSVGSKKLTMTCPNTVGSSCTLCLGNQCIACPITCGNQFKNTLTCKCESCSIANCANCNSGAGQCDRCKAGYQKSGNACAACSVGYYSNEGGSCQKCPKGTKANAASAATGCITCNGEKEYQNEEGQTTCKTCNYGTSGGFVTDNYTKCSICGWGTYWNGSSCQNCSPGYYSSTFNATSCKACEVGKYQDNSKQPTCKKCSGDNEYQDTTGQSSCKTCGANSVPNASHTGCSSTCQTTANCTGNQYLKDNCTCTACPSGQTPNSTKTGCDTVAADCSADGKYYIAATNSCGDCAAGCKTCTSSTSCSECTNATDYKLVNGVCKAYKYPASQADCDKLSNSKSIYIPLDVNQYDKATLSSTGGTHGFCMAKRNAGDLGGPEVSSAIKEIKAGDKKGTCDYDNGEKCCWVGHSGKSDKNRTAKKNTTDDSGKVTARYCTEAGSSDATIKGVHVLSTKSGSTYTKILNSFDYEACNRTVCNWYAADYICSNYAPNSGTSKAGDWGLPSKEALDALKNAVHASPSNRTDTSAKIYIQRWSGSNGLQLCQYSSNHNTAGSPRCDGSPSCYGSTANSCTPFHIWGQKGSEPVYYAYFLGDPGFSTSSYSDFGSLDFAYAKSVRCTLEKYID